MVNEKQEILWGLRIIIISFVLTVIWYVYKLVYSADPHILLYSWQILLCAFLAWGLAMRMNWVRIVVIVLSAVTAGISAFAMVVFVLLSLRARLNPAGWRDEATSLTSGETILVVVLFAFTVWEFLYLRSPSVRQQFQKYNTSAGSA